jgi:hypothetical protein
VASKKKTTKHEPDESDHVTVTATHEIRTDEQGNLLSCINLESGDDEPLPLEHRFLAN